MGIVSVGEEWTRAIRVGDVELGGHQAFWDIYSIPAESYLARLNSRATSSVSPAISRMADIGGALP